MYLKLLALEILSYHSASFQNNFLPVLHLQQFGNHCSTIYNNTRLTCYYYLSKLILCNGYFDV